MISLSWYSLDFCYIHDKFVKKKLKTAWLISGTKQLVHACRISSQRLCLGWIQWCMYVLVFDTVNNKHKCHVSTWLLSGFGGCINCPNNLPDLLVSSSYLYQLSSCYSYITIVFSIQCTFWILYTCSIMSKLFKLVKLWMR